MKLGKITTILSHLSLFFLIISCGGGKEEGASLLNPPESTIVSIVSNIIPPANSTYGLGASLDFQINFDANVTVTGSPCITLLIGSDNVNACYQSGSSTSTLNFSYTITAGQNDLDGIEMGNQIILGVGGSLKNAEGTNVGTTLSSILPDLSLVKANTSSGSPANQVTSLNQTNLSESRTDASFSWIAPNDNGNPITFYIIRYKKASETNFTYLSPNPTTTSTTITGLETEENYDVQVAAFNGVASPYSATLNFSTKFKPSSLGALIWYEAKDINGDGNTPSDGDIITRLVDKSGHNNHADLISGTGAQVNTVDGKKVIAFDTQGYRTLFSLGETNNTDVEVYMIAKTRSITSSFAFVNENQSNSNRFGSHFPWSNESAYIDLPIGNRMSGHWGGDINNFFAWTFRSSTTQGRALERNGTQILSGGNRNLTPPLKKWTIGSDYAGGNNFWKADFVAIFVFDKVLSTTQREDFFQYITNEYGITMVY